MSVGLAVISSPLPRCVEIIKEGGGGAIASNPNEVVAQLKYWESHQVELDQIRNQASHWASTHLDSEREYAIFAAEMVKLTR